ncbi:MAG: regulatory protein RecX [Micromonosporaceae bacterium]|nr:regulatory protein RecX [Micromonosporaceae bacterium]
MPAGIRGQRRQRTGAQAAEYARELCLRRLALRPYTRAELEVVLHRHGIDAAVAGEVLDRYREVGLVDDGAFARAWVTSRHHGKGLARRALARELRNKGVADETVGQALAEVTDAAEEAAARALVIRKLRSCRPDRPEATFRRLMGMLARKGYPPGLAMKVTREALSEHSDSFGDVEDIDVDVYEELDSDSRRSPK